MFVFIFFLSIFFLRYIKWPTTLSHFFFFFNKTNTKTDVPFSYFQKKKKSIFLEKQTLRLTILLICSKSQYFLEKQILKLTILSHFHNFFREKKKKKHKREKIFREKPKQKINQSACVVKSFFYFLCISFISYLIKLYFFYKKIS